MPCICVTSKRWKIYANPIETEENTEGNADKNETQNHYGQTRVIHSGFEKRQRYLRSSSA